MQNEGRRFGQSEISEEGVGLAFFADGGGGAVAGEDAGGVGEGEEARVNGIEELPGVAAGEVGAADGAGEEGVSGEEEVVVREVEAEAAGCVAGSVEDRSGESRWRGFGEGSAGETEVVADADEAVVGGAVVGSRDLGGGDAEPARLEVHDVDHGEVELVVEDGGAGEGFEAGGAGDVVDVGVGDDDLLDGELVLREQGEDAGDVVTWIDDHGLAGGFVAEDGAVAAERAYGEDLVDHGWVLGCRFSRFWVWVLGMSCQL